MKIISISTLLITLFLTSIQAQPINGDEWQNGYVINKKGERIDGQLQYFFYGDPRGDRVLEPNKARRGQVSVKYVNEKGKTKIARYAANKNVKFCVQNEGHAEQCFQGLVPMGIEYMAAVKIVTMGEFKLAEFYEIIGETPTIGLYKNPYYESFVIWRKSKPKGLEVSIGFENKKARRIYEYLGECIDLETIKRLELFDLEQVKELVSTYFDKCAQ